MKRNYFANVGSKKPNREKSDIIRGRRREIIEKNSVANVGRTLAAKKRNNEKSEIIHHVDPMSDVAA